jgi:cytochrome c553
MHEIVAKGRKPDVYACGVCHRADGPGGPENASLFGFTADYIIQQTLDFKNGLRNNSTPRVATDLMIKLAKAVTDQELKEAAEYFASIKPRANIKVVETDTVPKTHVRDLFLAAMDGGEKEPIGQRIVEIPEKRRPLCKPRLARPFHCLCSTRQHRERARIGAEQRPAHPVRRLSRRRPQRHCRGAWACRPFGPVHVPSAL